MVTPNNRRRKITGKKQQKRLTSYFQDPSTTSSSLVSLSSTSLRKRQRASSSSTSSSSNAAKFRAQNGGSSFGVCPICQSTIAWHILESHASECHGKSKETCDNDDNNSTKVIARQPGQSTIATATTTTNYNTASSRCYNNDVIIGSLKGESNSASTSASAIHQLVEKQSSSSSSSSSSPIRSIIPPTITLTTTTTTEVAELNTIISPQIAPIFHLKSPSSSSSSSATQQQQQQQLSRPHTFEPIPGLFVYEDFITEEEESMILYGIDVVDTLPWKLSKFNGKHIGKRWGVHCNLRDRRVDALENPLPDILQQIVLPKLKRLFFQKGKTKNTTIPNEANSIDYRRKQGHWLQDHVDDRKLSKEVIFNLSLIGDCYMTFKNIAKHRNIAVPKQRVLLKRRCLQIITGKSRYDFTHGITNSDLLSDRRISITMRESPLTKSKPKPKPITITKSAITTIITQKRIPR